MNFQSYKLPKNKKQKDKPEQPKRKVRTKLIAAICLSIIALVILVKAEAPKRIIRNTVVNTIAKDLEHDDLGYTNFLIMGTGGEGHDGKDLTDTLMIASINPSSSSTILSSVPRDIYVSHPQIISQRINSVYANQKYQSSHEEAAEVLGDIIEDLTNIEIHYNIKIDFQALVEVVDELGGVTINNQEAIYDPEYPGPNYTFQTFSLPAGEQTINGETALKYARSRKSSSDFERSSRQQQLIYAIKDAALSQNITSSPQKITSIYNSMSKHVETNLQLSEILTLAKLAQEFPEESLTTLPLTDDPNFIGGFLYNPPRSEYGDAYVLIPADSTNSQIHTYFELYRKYPFAMQANTEINLFNGTEINGFAGSVKQNLKRFGFTVNETANAQSNDYQQSQINLIGQNELLAQQVTESLNRLLEIPESQISYTPIQEDPTEANMDKVIINIILGEDLAEITEKLDVYSSLYSRIQQAINENRAAQNESNLLEEDSDQDDQDQPTNTSNQSEEEPSNELETDNTAN
jgi:LCP family protein required for cell wall assembly